MKRHVCRCIVCANCIEVCFSPPIKRINGLELECCNGKPKISIHILVVDDDKEFLEEFVDILEDENYVVDTAIEKKPGFIII